MASSRMTEQIGRVLGGRYRVRAPIGRGASAQVFLADDVRLRRPVAVKVLHDGLAEDQAFIGRFRSEAHAAAALNHPHVLAVYDWGEDDDGVPWIVTEYLGGGSLRGLLDRGHRLTPSQALVVALQAARGLDYAHRRGFVHRDVKPANLLFDDEGRLRIADFGLARALAEAAWTEPSGAVLGTARYASPEQAQGLALTGRADVYSLALVVVEAVTGEVPFAADTTLGTLMARVDRPLPVPDDLGPLAGPVAAAGRPDPERRLDARRLAGALARVATELPRPAPLPLAGALDALVHDADPTELAGRPPDAETLHAPVRREPGPLAPDPAIVGPAAVGSPVVGPAVAGSPVVDAAGGAADGGGAEDDLTEVEPSWRPEGDVVAGPVPPGPADAPPFDLADDDDLEPWDPRSPTGEARRRWPARLVVAVLLVGLVVALALLAGDLADARATHAVPDVTGQDPAAARAELSALGFVVDQRAVRREGSEAGEVLGTDPPAGTSVAEGDGVALLVSDGPPLVAVPAIAAGTPRADAEAALRAAGLVPVVETRFDEDVAAGRAIGLGPEVGEQAETGSEVPLVVSDGPEPRTVPDLAGRTESEALAALEALGLVGVATPRYDDDVPAGEVIGTEPAAGASAPRGSEVAVLVSRGPDLVTVPDVSGAADLAAAVALLEGAGLVAGEVDGPAAGLPSGTDPPAGSRVRRGSEVDILLR